MVADLAIRRELREVSMDRKRAWSNCVVGVDAAMIGFAVPHFVDDFLYDVPDEFGLTDPQGQILGGLMFTLLIVITSLAARGRRVGYCGTAFFGAFLAVAAATKHLHRILRAEPYWGGLPSEAFIVGLILSGSALAVVSLLALKDSRG